MIGKSFGSTKSKGKEVKIAAHRFVRGMAFGKREKKKKLNYTIKQTRGRENRPEKRQSGATVGGVNYFWGRNSISFGGNKPKYEKIHKW